MDQGLKAQIHRYAENREIDYMSAKNLGNAYGIEFANEKELVEFKQTIDRYLKTFKEDAFAEIEEACKKKGKKKAKVVEESYDESKTLRKPGQRKINESRFIQNVFDEYGEIDAYSIADFIAGPSSMGEIQKIISKLKEAGVTVRDLDNAFEYIMDSDMDKKIRNKLELFLGKYTQQNESYDVESFADKEDSLVGGFQPSKKGGKNPMKKPDDKRYKKKVNKVAAKRQYAEGTSLNDMFKV